MPPRKKKIIEPAIEPVIEPVIESEELPEDSQPLVIQEDTVTFKRSHFYAVLTVLAFAAGVLVGYVAWGYNAKSLVTAQAPVQTVVPPEPHIYKIETAGYPSLGPSDAPIQIVEFSDYQCPYCYRWHVQVYKSLLAAYPGKIHFVYRNFPLSFHQNAFASAEAALCAGDQNVYWKFHDYLFDKQAILNDQAGTLLDQATYSQFARDLGLDVVAFEKCMTSHKYKQSILEDANYANNLPADSNGEPAVGGTPTFFINGHRLGGAYPIEYFKQIIDAELKKSN